MAVGYLINLGANGALNVDDVGASGTTIFTPVGAAKATGSVSFNVMNSSGVDSGNPVTVNGSFFVDTLGNLYFTPTNAADLPNSVLSTRVNSVSGTYNQGGTEILDNGTGLQGDNDITGTSGNDIIYGSKDIRSEYGTGNDTINGLAGNDTIYAGDGEDRVEGGGGNDVIALDPTANASVAGTIRWS